MTNRTPTQVAHSQEYAPPWAEGKSPPLERLALRRSDGQLGERGPASSQGGISFRFYARDVHLVMGPMDGSTPVAFRVWIDRKPPRDASGNDVDDDGAGLLTEPRLYQLVRQRGPIVDRLFTIDFLDLGAEAFAFTFG